MKNKKATLHSNSKYECRVASFYTFRRVCICGTYQLFLNTGCANQINRIVYVQVNKDDTGGSKVEIYRYELPAYDEKGNEKTIQFTADKKLKKDVLLRLYGKKEKEVTTWEETLLVEFLLFTYKSILIF
ncbi:TPA: YxeA family protein [Bacillus cereus]